MIGEKVSELAELCQGKVIDLISSGYNRRVLPDALLALLSGLADLRTRIEEPEEIPQRFRQDRSLTETEMVIEEVKRNLRDYWGCLR